ncbi:sigma-54-dependent transcriptional regulator [Dyadobacter sandarakinus]|uniref:Sigma-54-dependent Fis family transcriptional regulator n=1 Tax=Dyadobacter sandarakinus TaxID=2747268 RepID=A0ABX7I3V8_9BACT|nr:sigma-54 dependent transcriptional regulator [Dyadobacter sandarakinus]QRR00524.1 sigma-54-dependent Fis family transcriptional regulator [Dyadobacter sandarakinus]
MSKILVIDDEDKLRGLIARVISLEGFQTLEAADIKTAWKKLEQSDIDVVLCDVKLPDGHGVTFVKDLKAKYPSIEAVLLTAYGNIEDGVQAIKNGAFDYITKGDDNNKIIPLLHRAMEKAELNKRVINLEKQLGQKHSFDAIIGKSRKLLASVDLARRVAPTDTTVLLLGETGTGKEVFAQSIHQGSGRAKKPFVAVNCSAFGKDLLESEMFGHKAGAFTGALRDKKGLFEEASAGTIFLDEIGELAHELQAKLLRVLETGEFLKIGDTQPTRVNVRVIAATNRDLQKEIEKGEFRSDLYYRLSVFQITIPALRERTSDIASLASSFAAQFSLKANRKIASLSEAYISALEHYPWPGNIRELKNVIERSVILTDGPVLDVQSLPYELTQPAARDHKGMSAFSMSSAEKIHLQKVLNYTQGNKAEAARLLEIGIATLYRKIEEYKL